MVFDQKEIIKTVIEMFFFQGFIKNGV